MKTFKVISPVIRLRREGGIFKGRNNVDYPIRNAAQYAALVPLEETADVVIACTPEERAEYEKQLSSPAKPAEAPTPAPTVPAQAPAAPKAPEIVGKEDEVKKNDAPQAPTVGNGEKDPESDI